MIIHNNDALLVVLQYLWIESPLAVVLGLVIQMFSIISVAATNQGITIAHVDIHLYCNYYYLKIPYSERFNSLVGPSQVTNPYLLIVGP